MTDLTDTTLSALRAKAEAATPGPWEHNGRAVSICREKSKLVIIADGMYYRNASYIAAANPATILALLDALAEARKEIGQLMTEIYKVNGSCCDCKGTGYYKYCGETCPSCGGSGISATSVDADEIVTLRAKVAAYDGRVEGLEAAHKAEIATLRAENERLREIIRLNPNNNRSETKP
jgi:hypothetical protein